MDPLSCNIQKDKENAKEVSSPDAVKKQAGLKVKASAAPSYENASHIKEFDKYNAEGKHYEERVVMYLKFVSYNMTRGGKPIKNKEIFTKCGISKTAAHG